MPYTSAEVRGHFAADAHSRSTVWGVALAALSLGLWAATLAGIVLVPYWSVKLLLAVVNGLLIATAFVVGHDGGHGSLTPSRRLNRFLGRACLLPALHPFASWCHTHNALHHGFTNIKGKDPGFPPLTLEEYRALPAWQRWLERRYRTWYGLGLFYFVEMWLRWEMFPNRENSPRDVAGFRFDRLCVIAFAAAWAGGLAWAGLATDQSWWGLVLVGFVLPWALFNYFFGFTIFQHHTHPRIPWFRPEDGPTYFRTQVKSCPHIMMPKSVDAVMHQIMEHTAHHADAAVPLYRLPAAQKRIERAFRKEVVRILWTPANFMNVLRSCKLYDFAQHRWTDYNGVPTTPSLLPANAALSPEGAAVDSQGRQPLVGV